MQTFPRSSRIFGCSSTGHIGEKLKKISVRQKGRSYKPSNRYTSIFPTQPNAVDDKIVMGEKRILCNSCAKNCPKSSNSSEKEKIPEKEDLDEMIKPQKPRLPRIDAKRCVFGSNSRKDARERVFDIITSERTMEKLCPMRLDDPDQMLMFLENYLGIKKRSMGWFPSRQSRAWNIILISVFQAFFSPE